MLSSIILTTILFGAMASVDASTASGKTKGDVMFEQGDVPGTVDPVDPTEPIDPTDKIEPDIIETDGIAIINAPTFHFGTVKINPNGEEYPALQAEYTKAGATVFGAHFLQVVDVSGNDNALWDVSVKQDDVFKAGSDKLDNTRIRLYGQTLLNSELPIGTDVTGFTLGSDGYTEIPVGNGLEILRSKTKGFTNSTYTSNIFEKDHDSEISDTTQGKNEYVKLSVPRGEKPKINASYETDLTWTLTVAP